jgi:Fic family protein
MEYNKHMSEFPDAMPPTEPIFAAIETPEIVSKIAEIDFLRSRIDALKSVRPDIWPTIQEKLRIFWTADSNAIEGSSLTRAETAFFLREGLTVEGKPLKDFLDARNHAEAIDYLSDVISTRRSITPHFLKEINAILLKGIEWTPAINEHGHPVRKRARPGEYKKQPNHVLQFDGNIHYYLDPLQVPGAIEHLCAQLDEAEQSKTHHPIIVAALSHYEFVRIHPFDDGNGRGARLLMNLILMKAGYPPAVITTEQRRAYLAAIRAADDGDRSRFCTFIADTLHATEKLVSHDLGGA